VAKRFTDTAKWDKSWFRKLKPEMKCVWIFLCDRCDHAGVWEIDEDTLNFFVGCPLTIREIEDVFGDKIEVFGTKLVLKSFAEFQYGHLNPDNRVHKSVLNRLEKVTPSKGLKRPFQGSKDTDTDKDTDADKEKGESEGKISAADLEAAYAAYPRKEGKTPGMRAAKAQIKTQSDLCDLVAAISNYKKNLAHKKTEPGFILLWSTFMNQWRDWLDPQNGKGEDFSGQAQKSILEIIQEVSGDQ